MPKNEQLEIVKLICVLYKFIQFGQVPLKCALIVIIYLFRYNGTYRF